MPGCLHRSDAPCAMCAAAGKAALLIGLTAMIPGCSRGQAVYGVPVVDGDNDGYDEYDDCDDTDASIHPEADDPDGDGIDQNCDGADGIADSGM